MQSRCFYATTQYALLPDPLDSSSTGGDETVTSSTWVKYETIDVKESIDDMRMRVG